MHSGKKIDDVIQEMVEQEAKKKEKKVNSGRKGKGWERDLCKVLTKRFDRPFSRTPGSGAFATAGKMNEKARGMLAGDIITPEEFKFVIEAKKGYPVDLHSLWSVGDSKYFKGGRRSDLKIIIGFMCQAMRDAERSNKDWMVMWRMDNRCPLGICSHSTESAGLTTNVKIEWIICKKDWKDVEGSSILPSKMIAYIYPLADLLNLSDDFWIEPTVNNNSDLIAGNKNSSD